MDSIDQHIYTEVNGTGIGKSIWIYDSNTKFSFKWENNAKESLFLAECSDSQCINSIVLSPFPAPVWQLEHLTLNLLYKYWSVLKSIHARINQSKVPENKKSERFPWFPDLLSIHAHWWCVRMLSIRFYLDQQDWFVANDIAEYFYINFVIPIIILLYWFVF